MRASKWVQTDSETTEPCEVPYMQAVPAGHPNGRGVRIALVKDGKRLLIELSAADVERAAATLPKDAT